MRLVARSKDIICNMRVDSIDRQGDVIFAYRKADGSMTADQFAGMFDLGSVDFLYVTDERKMDGE